MLEEYEENFYCLINFKSAQKLLSKMENMIENDSFDKNQLLEMIQNA